MLVIQRRHSEELRERIENTELSDEQRIAAAQSWVRFDPENAEVGVAIVGAITPQTPLSLLEGLLQAAAENSSAQLADEMIALYDTLSPQGRVAVLNEVLKQPQTTAALLNAPVRGRVVPACQGQDRRRKAITGLNQFVTAR